MFDRALNILLSIIDFNTICQGLSIPEIIPYTMSSTSLSSMAIKNKIYDKELNSSVTLTKFRQKHFSEIIYRHITEVSLLVTNLS